MRKLEFKEGSITPFWMKDLEYLQKGCAEVIQAIAQGLSFNKRDFIISGCKITDNGTKISMTSGWCYYEGEILPVNSMPVTSYKENPKIKFTKISRYDREGDRIISLSGTTGMSQVYSNCYLEPTLVSGDENYTLAISNGAWDLGERIANAAKAADVLEQISLKAHSGKLQYRRIGGTVQLMGDVWNDANGAGIHVAVASGLPCPNRDLTIKTVYATVEISKEGVLTIDSEYDKVYLDGIIYLTTPSYNGDDGHYTTIMNDNGEISI